MTEGNRKDIRVDDIIYDTVKCTAFIAYDTVKNAIEKIYLMSNLCYTEQASVSWQDLGMYGACSRTCVRSEYPKLAECIRDKEWAWTSRHGVTDTDCRAGNVPGPIKEEVLEKLQKY